MRLSLDGRVVQATTGGREPDRSLPLVVFVHGAGNDRTVWQLQTRYFAHHGHAVVALDLPDHGGSDGPAPTSIDGYASWLSSVLDELGWSHVHLVGHSMGSLIALELAGTGHGSLSSVSLLGTSASMGVHPDLLAAAAADDHLAYELITGWSHSPAGRRGGHPTPGVWMSGTTMRLLERSRPGVLASDLAACAAYDDAVERAAAVAVPALVLVGARDLMTRARDAAPIIDALPSARSVVLEGTGHQMMTEQPDAVIDELASFLDDVSVS